MKRNESESSEISLTLRRRNFPLNFSTPCTKNVNNTEPKKVTL